MLMVLRQLISLSGFNTFWLFIQEKDSREIGSLVGKVAHLDLKTDNRTRGRFTRMVVHVDLDKPLISASKAKGNRLRKKALVKDSNNPKSANPFGSSGLQVVFRKSGLEGKRADSEREIFNVDTDSIQAVGNNPVHNNPVFDGPNESMVILDANSLDPKCHSAVIFKNKNNRTPKGNNKGCAVDGNKSNLASKSRGLESKITLGDAVDLRNSEGHNGGVGSTTVH
ncbi:hypothetical protein Gogos_000533 [Gossypium gossypioides]|uniref:DUF4283 domain-containing protein n=1 Tax=Gossypium gossypioides TaxID=34282 RepID=A0A7J9CTA0_GOSGO|nr:hypothetical protein [Gossypium gossypioides]